MLIQRVNMCKNELFVINLRQSKFKFSLVYSSFSGSESHHWAELCVCVWRGASSGAILLLVVYFWPLQLEIGSIYPPPMLQSAGYRIHLSTSPLYCQCTQGISPRQLSANINGFTNPDRSPIQFKTIVIILKRNKKCGKLVECFILL